MQHVNFNSNMVRLKGDCFGGANSRRALFQFQYGSIKSNIIIFYRDRQALFQFQYGSIKSTAIITIVTSDC